MSEQVWTNCKLYLAQYDLSGSMNALALDYKADTPENTTFGETTKSRLGGLKDVAVALNGYFDANPDQILFTQIGLTNAAMTVAPTGADGEPAFILRPALAGYTPGAKVGEVLAFAVKGEGGGPLVKGAILLPSLARIASNSGVARQLGAATALQKVYAALHVFAAAGGSPTLDVKVQSDDNQNFTSPADVIVFAQKTAAGYEWKEAAGPVTDTWWRINYVIGGSTPSLTFAVSVGIL